MLNRQDLGDGGILTDFQISRQGYGTAVSDIGTINATLPTRFARPVRSSAGQYLVPYILTGTGPPDLGLLSPIIGLDINCAALRQSATSTALVKGPLFSFDNSNPGNPSNSGLISDANNPNRNPYFRQQQLSRLGNLVTGRSNVFAVWITVGFFTPLPARACRPTPHPNRWPTIRRSIPTVTPGVAR